MVELYGRPFVELVDRMRLEFARTGAIFDLPARRWWLPTEGGPDLSVQFHDRVAGSPVGPASGPQSQMAQNIVLSWLAGGRIMELKTVQVNDALKIGRPCIDAANLGYNIEWSQELRGCRFARSVCAGGDAGTHAADGAGGFRGAVWRARLPRNRAGETIYDMSIGYDLAGIRSDKVRRFMEGMIDATPSVERLRTQSCRSGWGGCGTSSIRRGSPRA